jgi:ACT domain-containing protein
MKILITSICLLVLSTATLAQDDAITRFFSEFETSQDFTKITMSSKMFELFLHLEGQTEEEKELIQTISKIKGMKVLALDSDQDSKAKALYKNALKRPSAEYESLMTVEEDDSQMSFFIRESNGIIAELLMILGGDTDFVIMSLTGDIDLNQIANLGRSMDINGMNQLQYLSE